MTELLTIGQFSRVCWLSVKALRLYDDSRFQPAHIDSETKYRYCAVEQAPVARGLAGPPFDIYLSDPAESKDPAKIQTEIV